MLEKLKASIKKITTSDATEGKFHGVIMILKINPTIIIIPIIASLLIGLLGKDYLRLNYFIALSSSLIVFLLSLYLLYLFDPLSTEYQFQTQINWITQFNIQYFI